jgi:hypothetical protein
LSESSVHEGFCEDLARQTTVTHLFQLQLGSGVVTYKLRVVTCGLRVVTYGLRAITYGLRAVTYGLRAVTYGLRVVTFGCDFILRARQDLAGLGTQFSTWQDLPIILA